MGNEESAQDPTLFEGTRDEDMNTAANKQRSPAKPTPTPSSSTSSSPGGAPPPGAVQVRRRRGRNSSVNAQDIQAVRAKISQYTSSLDMKQQWSLVTGAIKQRAKEEDEGGEEQVVEKEEEEEENDEEEEQQEQQEAAAPAPRRAPVVMGRGRGGRGSLATQAVQGSLMSAIPEDIAAAVKAEQGAAAAPPPGGRVMNRRRSSRRGGVIRFDSEEELQRKQQRDMVIQEIQASEQLYYKFLRLMIDKFITPMREDNVLTEEQISAIFSNIEKLAPYHEVIGRELETENVGDVFLKYASSLRVYTPYVNNYDSACQLVASLKKNKEFSAFLKERRKDPEMGGLDIMSFLIMPIQRIPRYRMLLSELRKYSKDTDEDGQLDEALRQIETIANYVNEAKREAENRSKIVAIQEKVNGDFENLLQPGRQIVREGELKVKKLVSSNSCCVYLFNDLLLWTTPKHDLIDTVHLAMVSVEDYESKSKVGFTISSPALTDGDVVFLCKSQYERKLWRADIGVNVQACRVPVGTQRGRGRRNRSLFRSNVMPAPMLRSDSSSSVESDGAAPPTGERAKKRRQSILARLEDLGADQVDDSRLQPLEDRS